MGNASSRPAARHMAAHLAALREIAERWTTHPAAAGCRTLSPQASRLTSSGGMQQPIRQATASRRS